MPKPKRLEIPDFKNLALSAEQLVEALPEAASNIAVNFFQERFRKKGWIGSAGFERWQDRKDQNARGSLMLVSSYLKDAFSKELGKNYVKITNYAPYSGVHNEGLRVRAVVYVRPHVNRNFIGKGKRVHIRAHAKRIDFKMPKRQFMGHSDFLMQRLDHHFGEQLKKLELKFLS